MLKYGYLFNINVKILIFQASWYKENIVFRANQKSTLFQRCFNVEFYRWINVDKSTLNQRGYHVDRCRDVISTYINVESTLSICWDSLPLPLVSLILWIFEEENPNREKKDRKNKFCFTTFKNKLSEYDEWRVRWLFYDRCPYHMFLLL